MNGVLFIKENHFLLKKKEITPYIKNNFKQTKNYTSYKIREITLNMKYN